MKKVLSILLPLIFAVSIVGCNTETDPSSMQDSVSSQASSVISSGGEESSEAVSSEPAPEHRLSFLGFGDNIIHGAVYHAARVMENGKVVGHNFLPFYEDVAPLIAEADISFINQETPMCGDHRGFSNYPRFNTPQQMGKDLVTLGFDIISVANNHMIDQGASGLAEEIDFLDSLSVFHVGAYRNQKDYDTVRIFQKDGLKIAVLSYTFSTNGLSLPSGSELIIPWTDKNIMTRQIRAAKELSDMVIVSVHWGDEDSFSVNQHQRSLAQMMADEGVAVVLGHHPHVIHPIEWVEGESGNQTLVYYSLGNMLNSQLRFRNMVGLIASFNICWREGEAPRIENASCIPTVSFHRQGFKDYRLLTLEHFTPELAAAHFSNTQESSPVTVEWAKKIITDYVDVEFLPDYLK
ncbi:MAG: CapA family protein [Ruminococcaceae bacterium]|nr:CapA family protein [Oscillospiraceae bacterium]